MKATKILPLLFLSLFLLSCIDAEAQQRRGLRKKKNRGKMWIAPIVGANYSILLGDHALNYDWKPGVHGGALLDIGFRNHIVLEPGLIYSMKGTKYTKLDDVKLNMHYAELLFNFKIKVGYTERVNFIAGPYVGYLVAANVTDGSDNIDAKDELAPIDFGLNLGGGIQLKEGLAVSLHYDMGLANINEYIAGRPTTPKNTNSAVMLSVMYFIKAN
jgi:hypothetical protein